MPTGAFRVLSHTVANCCKGLPPEQGIPGHAPPETLRTYVSGRSETRVSIPLTWL